MGEGRSPLASQGKASVWQAKAERASVVNNKLIYNVKS